MTDVENDVWKMQYKSPIMFISLSHRKGFRQIDDAQNVNSCWWSSSWSLWSDASRASRAARIRPRFPSSSTARTSGTALRRCLRPGLCRGEDVEWSPVVIAVAWKAIADSPLASLLAPPRMVGEPVVERQVGRAVVRQAGACSLIWLMSLDEIPAWTLAMALRLWFRRVGCWSAGADEAVGDMIVYWQTKLISRKIKSAGVFLHFAVKMFVFINTVLYLKSK